MRRKKQLTFCAVGLGAIVLALVAAQAVAAPKKLAAKIPAQRPEVVMPAMAPFVSSFMTYDVGTLRMTGKTAADSTYTIGTLQLTGRSIASTIYSVGTLSMTGRQEP